MTMQTVFLYYATEDGQYFSNQIRNILTRTEFDVWHDFLDLPRGHKLKQTIFETIQQADAVVVVLTQAALDADMTLTVCNHAREHGTHVFCVAHEGIERLPQSWRWFKKYEVFVLNTSLLGSLNTSQNKPVLERLIAQLADLPDLDPRPYIVPSLPNRLVRRDNEISNILDSLLDEVNENPIALTTSRRGVGGTGKTTLAITICHEPIVRWVYDDGILWVQFSNIITDGDVLELLNQQIKHLGGTGKGLDLRSASSSFKRLLRSRKMLLVLDDLWDMRYLNYFVTSDTTYIITTQSDEVVLKTNASQILVDEMDTHEATDLLAYWVGTEHHDHPKLYDLAGRLGEWALLVDLVGAELRALLDVDYTLDDAYDYIVSRFADNGLNYVDMDDAKCRYLAVKSSIEATLSQLPDTMAERFYELSILPGDAIVPFRVIHSIWQHTCDYTYPDTEEALYHMRKLSLFNHYLSRKRAVNIHPVVRDVISRQNKNTEALHQLVINSYDDFTALPHNYAWRNLAYHLEHAGQIETLRELLLDFGYLQAKLEATDINAIIEDCDIFPENEPIQIVKFAIDRSSHILKERKHRLAEVLSKHLSGYQIEYDDIRELMVSIHENTTQPELFTQIEATFLTSGALLRTLDGHKDSINFVVIQGEIAFSCSGSHYAIDKRINVWNWETGELLRTMEGHADSVNQIAVSDQFMVSASSDGTLKVWNWQTGRQLRTLHGHRNAVKSVALSGIFAVSASADWTLKVWNWQTGELLRTIEGHTGSVNHVALAGSYAISGSSDWTLRVWNWQSGMALRTMEGHEDVVNHLSLSSRFVVSASGSSLGFDNTIRVWDWQTGESLRTLRGHVDGVNHVALHGSFAVSASGAILDSEEDYTLKVWNWETGEMLRTLEGHADAVMSVALNGAVAVSASRDGMLKVWNYWKGLDRSRITRPATLAEQNNREQSEWTGELIKTIEGHSNAVNNISLYEGLVASGSEDKKVKIWNWARGELLQTLHGHANSVTSTALDDEIVISASSDASIRVWNWVTSELLHILEGHDESVTDIAMSESYVVSASHDNTLKVWDWESGKLLRTLQGHTESVVNVALSDTYAVSASKDSTLNVWNWRTGELLRTLQGHTAPIYRMAMSESYVVSASHDNTLKLWDWQTGELVRTLSQHRDELMSVLLSHNLAVSTAAGSYGLALNVWNWRTGERFTTYIADAPQETVVITPQFERIVCGGYSGQVYFLRPNATLMKLVQSKIREI